MVKAPLAFYRSKWVLHQCLSSLIGLGSLSDSFFIALNVRGKLGALNNLSILLGGGAQMTNGTPFTGRGFVLFKTVVSGGVPTALTSYRA